MGLTTKVKKYKFVKMVTGLMMAHVFSMESGNVNQENVSLFTEILFAATILVM